MKIQAFAIIVGALCASSFAQTAPSGAEQPGKPAGGTATAVAANVTTSSLGIATALLTDSIVMIGGQLFWSATNKASSLTRM